MREVAIRRPRPLHGVWLLGAALVAAAALAPAGAVAQPTQQTSASISGQADWITNNHIIVYVTFQGFGGCCGGMDVQVSQATPPFGSAMGNGGMPVFCDGHRQTHAVAVFGGGFPGFRLGEAEATVQVFCPSPFPPGTDSQSIRITKP